MLSAVVAVWQCAPPSCVSCIIPSVYDIVSETALFQALSLKAEGSSLIPAFHSMSRAGVSLMECRQRKQIRNSDKGATACFLCSPIALVAALGLTHLYSITHFKHFAALLVKQHLQQKSLWFGIKELGIKHLRISQKANCPKSVCKGSPNQNKL